MGRSQGSVGLFEPMAQVIAGCREATNPDLLGWSTRGDSLMQLRFRKGQAQTKLGIGTARTNSLVSAVSVCHCSLGVSQFARTSQGPR